MSEPHVRLESLASGDVRVSVTGNFKFVGARTFEFVLRNDQIEAMHEWIARHVEISGDVTDLVFDPAKEKRGV